MKNHLVTITKRKIFIPSVEDSTINALDRGSDQIHLKYDEEWDGLDIYLILFDEPESLVTRYEGEPRHYPDAEGPVYEALEDTSYSPDTYPDNWTKLSGEVTL